MPSMLQGLMPNLIQLAIQKKLQEDAALAEWNRELPFKQFEQLYKGATMKKWASEEERAAAGEARAAAEESRKASEQTHQTGFRTALEQYQGLGEGLAGVEAGENLPEPDMPNQATSLGKTRELMSLWDQANQQRKQLKTQLTGRYAKQFSDTYGNDAATQFSGFDDISKKIPEFKQKIDTAVSLGLGSEREIASKILMNETPGPDYKPHVGPQGQVSYINQDPKPGENILAIPTNPDGSPVLVPGMAEDYEAKLTTLGGEIYAQRRAEKSGDKEAAKLHGQRIQRIVTGLDMLVPVEVWDNEAKATLIKYTSPTSPEARAGIVKKGPEAPPPKVQEDIQSSALMYDLTERMREWVASGNTEGLKGYFNKTKQLLADAGVPIRDQDLFDFNANLNTITSRIDEIAKGNPSDRDIPRYLAAFPDMIQAAGSNEAKINVIQYMNREAMKMKLAFMKASRYAIPREVANTAKAMGIDINKLNESDYVGFDATTNEPIQQGAKLKATLIKNAPANLRNDVKKALDARDATIVPGSTPIKVY